jgi:hypothetical protein
MMVYACMNVASNGASDALAGDRIATPFAAAHESLSWREPDLTGSPDEVRS